MSTSTSSSDGPAPRCRATTIDGGLYPAVIAALLVAASTSCIVPRTDTEAQIALDYRSFDALGGAYGWRVLNGSGCTDAAVSLLAAYGAANASRMTADERRELAFHAGQALAFAGRDAEAIAQLERSADADAAPEWRLYVAATLAFLRRDAAALATARAAYEKVAAGSMRLRIIDGLIACPDAPYMQAAHCRM